jgi:hypothetical protein
MSKARLVRNVAIALVVILSIAYGGASAVVWDKLTKVSGGCHEDWASNDPTHFEHPGVDTTPYLMPPPRLVAFPSRDAAIQISGWWVVAGDPAAPAVVVVHGHTACKRDPDGDSTVEDGRYAGGTEEFRDVLGAWDWLQSAQSLPAERIGLLGISLGAATVLIASGEEAGVAATWEDSSYADIGVAIRAELDRNGYPRFLETGGVAMARLISGDDLESRSPLTAVSRMGGRRLSITHGTADERLSVEYAYELTAAATAVGADVDSWIVPGAGHTEAMWVARETYERRLVDFFTDALSSGA